MGSEAKVGDLKATNKSYKFLKDTKAELKKITWPSKEEVSKSTVTVFGYIVLFTLILWGYDSIFHLILGKALGY